MPDVMQQVRTQPVLELKSLASLSPEAWLPLLTSQCQFTAQRPTSGCFQVLRPNLAQVENQLQVLLWSFKPLSLLNTIFSLPCPPNLPSATYNFHIQPPKGVLWSKLCLCIIFCVLHHFFSVFASKLPAPAAPFGGLPKGFSNLLCPTHRDMIYLGISTLLLAPINL